MTALARRAIIKPMTAAQYDFLARLSEMEANRLRITVECDTRMTADEKSCWCSIVENTLREYAIECRVRACAVEMIHRLIGTT